MMMMTTSALAEGKSPLVAASRPSRIPLPSASPGFAAAIAVLANALRLFTFDLWEYFGLRGLPNHDMYQAAATFATSMHSIRVDGDIAWWLPTGTEGGYAQYFNHFLSPLAPTAGNLVFVVWSGAVSALNTVGIAAPEYLQYLAITFVVYPFLAYFALGLLCSELLSSRLPVALVVVTYALSGIGLWNSAWFYYQEPATTFFLLYALVALIRAPSQTRVLVFAAAVLIQISSLNYWTVYNAWFVGAFVCAYAAMFWPNVRNLGRWLRRTRFRRATVVPLVLVAAAAAVWLVLLLNVVFEQRGVYLRDGRPATGFTVDDAYDRMRVSDVRRFTTELFNPRLQRPLKSYPILNEIHNARYIGACLLPLLVPFFLLRWHRVDRWLVTVTACVLLVTLCSGALLQLWAITPMMSQIQHQFYFYQHYLQFCLVMIAARVLDRLLTGTVGMDMRPVVIRMNVALAAVAFLSMVTTFLFAESFQPSDEVLGSVNGAAVLVIAGCALAHQMLLRRSGSRTVFGLLLLLILGGDLSRYFLVGSKEDQAFTHQRRYGVVIGYPLSPAIRSAFARPWEVLDPHALDGGLFENMPVANWFWPENAYNRSRFVYQWRALTAAQRAHAEGRPSVAMVEALRTSEDQWLTADDPGDVPPGTAVITRWGYNDLRLQSDAARDGWLVLSTLFDPYWRARVDAQDAELRRVDYRFLAVEVPRGRHVVELSYWPFSRALYPWAKLMLVVSLGLVAFGARRLGQLEATP